VQALDHTDLNLTHSPLFAYPYGLDKCSIGEQARPWH
jgi:hypothetical protein